MLGLTGLSLGRQKRDKFAPVRRALILRGEASSVLASPTASPSQSPQSSPPQITIRAVLSLRAAKLGWVTSVPVASQGALRSTPGAIHGCHVQKRRDKQPGSKADRWAALREPHLRRHPDRAPHVWRHRKSSAAFNTDSRDSLV